MKIESFQNFKDLNFLINVSDNFSGSDLIYTHLKKTEHDLNYFILTDFAKTFEGILWSKIVKFFDYGSDFAIDSEFLDLYDFVHNSELNKKNVFKYAKYSPLNKLENIVRIQNFYMQNLEKNNLQTFFKNIWGYRPELFKENEENNLQKLKNILSYGYEEFVSLKVAEKRLVFKKLTIENDFFDLNLYKNQIVSKNFYNEKYAQRIKFSGTVLSYEPKFMKGNSFQDLSVQIDKNLLSFYDGKFAKNYSLLQKYKYKDKNFFLDFKNYCIKQIQHALGNKIKFKDLKLDWKEYFVSINDLQVWQKGLNFISFFLEWFESENFLNWEFYKNKDGSIIDFWARNQVNEEFCLFFSWSYVVKQSLLRKAFDKLFLSCNEGVFEIKNFEDKIKFDIKKISEPEDDLFYWYNNIEYIYDEKQFDEK